MAARKSNTRSFEDIRDTFKARQGWSPEEKSLLTVLATWILLIAAMWMWASFH
ncbi:MAG: hypothetical protein ACREJD_00460 [Phycisphaerales bacterium]